jgi:protoheme ferro-lyase
MALRLAIIVVIASSSWTDAEHVGVLFSSFGDVENCECIDSYWPNALAQLVNYEIPVPRFTRGFFGRLVWTFSRREIMAQYKAIAEDCNTHYQENAVGQAERVVSVLRTLRPQHKFTAYTGYNFVSGKGCPSGVTVVDQARKALSEGVDTLVLVNQNGAQQSNTSIGVSYEQIAPALTDPEWDNVDVLGLDDYSQKTGFENLIIDFLGSQFQSLLGSKGVAPANTCMMALP